MNGRDNITPLEPRNPIMIGTEKSNVTETQDREIKIVVMNMFKDLKWDMNQGLFEDQEIQRKQLNKIMKTIQDKKIEFNNKIESLK